MRCELDLCLSANAWINFFDILFKVLFQSLCGICFTLMMVVEFIPIKSLVYNNKLKFTQPMTQELY